MSGVRIPCRSCLREIAVPEIAQLSSRGFFGINCLCSSCAGLDPKEQILPHRDYIETFTGRRFWLPDFDADEICIEDIAHHLAMICRFGGAARRHYSVAEHSLLVLYLVEARPQPAAVRLGALLHDCGEAYVGDICRPLAFLARDLKLIERAIRAAAFARFGAVADQVIKDADDVMLASEAAALMATGGQAWGGLRLPPDQEMVDLLRRRNGMTLDSFHPAWAEEQFLREFRRIRQGMGAEA